MNNRLRRSIQQILLAGSTAVFAASTLAAVGQQNPPPGPGQIPDYFGVVPNYANSPQPRMTEVTVSGTGTGAVLVATTYDYATDTPTETVMDVQVLVPGTGYTDGDLVTVTGGAGSTAAEFHAIVDAGTIIGIQEIPSATNTPAIPFVGLGSGFKTPIAGTGIRKFVDTLPGLNTANNLGQQMPIGVADTTTFPGSDYYEIAEVEYTQKLHSDLPSSHLRGYVQIKTGGFNVADFNAATDKLAYASQYAGYLGPVIVAQKDKPVRVKLVNLLSKTGDVGTLEGKLPVPVDTTYMGADNATDTDNRTSMHLHGGNTPWISDGTARQWTKPAGEVGPNKGESARSVPDMWFDASGNLINDPSCIQGTITCGVAGASNYPGDGALTFFYTNEQSARLMFYHDHAEGTTRLNVYAGMAGAYVLQDPTEQALVDGGTLPPLADTIPLVIQEKTFVPDDTKPVLNFYGPFKSQLNSQDPTWRWGTGSAVTGTMGNGDLWVPHVFMPNQNPGDITGANAVGRWDYGAWFWPPFANLQNGPIANPYYDAACDTTVEYCEGPEIPGVPNGSLQAVLSNGVAGGVPDASKGGAITESPSSTPEAFNDTPLVNGTAYPSVNVDPKKYRLRILSVGNDRMLNLSLVVAASKNTDTTALGNAGPVGTAPAVLCDGTSGHPTDSGKVVGDEPECTEVKMVPFDATQNKAANTPFPTHWYSPQKGGVTFDGRPSGVFDPNTRGPAMVQIGTEGGFLSKPVVIKNQPVNYEYNPKNILIGNIKEHALLLGPAERADVLVDFSNFAGSTVILYNDAGAPVPAWDLRLDYYTGNFDNTDTGGAFSVIPGYGPNSRTLMQFRVSGTGGTHPVDDLGSINMATLTPAIQTAFKTSQEHIVVPQAAYNTVYGINATDGVGKDLSSIFSTTLSYNPLSMDALGNFSLVSTPVKLELEPKTIIEDWTMNWGRMNALLGTEVPHTTAINQTSIPQAFIDPPTDLVKITPNDNMVPVSGTLPDGTQLWKITHNGVDSHAVHFHLFHVQVVNRVGWDGAIYPPEANELGWKDTVLMHPLSDVIVAMRPMVMKGLPFKVPNSHRLIDPARAAHLPPVDPLAPANPAIDVFNFNPLTGNASDITNEQVNYGWEYLWHCHILGHEENDMMRTIAVAQPPEAPINLTATTVATGVKLDWTDDSIISNWVTVQRALDSGFNTGLTAFNVVVPECNSQAGCPVTYTDTTAPAATDLYYRVMANNTVGAGDGKLDAPRNPDGSYGGVLPPELSTLTPGFTGYANVTANSDWSGVASRLVSPIAIVSPASLVFPDTVIGTTSAALTATLSNTGNGVLNIASIATDGAPFAVAAGGTCGATLAPATDCTINVAFTPTVVGAAPTGTLTITDDSSTGSTQTVSLSGTGLPATPVAPSNVSIQRISTTAAILAWTDASNNETSFQVQSAISVAGPWNTLSTVTRTAAEGTATGDGLTYGATVSNSTNLFYRVVAINAAGSIASVNVSLNDTVLPAVPTNLTGSKVTTTFLGFPVRSVVTLNWADVANNNVTYRLQRSTNNGATWTNVNVNIGANATTFSQVLTGFPLPTVTNQYRIAAANSVGASAWSSTFTIVTP
jgi:FtsP/CotA-like multicopper oxidase with cupredoxin domain